MWIYIPDPDESKQHWVGTITPPDGSKSLWSFELIRQMEPGDMYGTSPFDGQKPVVGLLNHQRRCTLVRPRVRRIDPGSIGTHYTGMRTQISGSFQALLTDLAVEDGDKKIFGGFSFSSEAFSLWFEPQGLRARPDRDTQIAGVNIIPADVKEFELPAVGHVTCTTGEEVTSKGHSRTILLSSTLFIDLRAPIALGEIVNNCLALDRLFGFLIGSRTKPPTLTTWTDETYCIGGKEHTTEGTLEVAGEDWQLTSAPHASDCIHTQGAGGGTLEAILGKFFDAPDDIMDRIRAIEFSRHSSRNMNDRFSVLMPILEAYLKRRYTEEDERSFIDFEKSFFDWVESSKDENIIEFSRKHITVKARKAPSLSTLLSRAISFVNSKGFASQTVSQLGFRRVADASSTPHPK